MRGLLVSLCILGLAACAHSPRAGDNGPAHIAAQLDRFLAGVSVGDASVHDWWWADDLIYTSSNGTRFGKATILEGAAQPQGPGAPSVIYTAEDAQVRVRGKQATLTFRLVAMTNGQRSEYLNSGFLQQIDQVWQVVVWQATKVQAGVD